MAVFSGSDGAPTMVNWTVARVGWERRDDEEREMTKKMFREIIFVPYRGQSVGKLKVKCIVSLKAITDEIDVRNIVMLSVFELFWQTKWRST